MIDVIIGSGDRIVLSHQQLKNIQQKIERLTALSKEEKNKLAKNHKSEIRSSLTQQKKRINENICPRCGNQLVVRKGKYGSFKGCSNYPKCKFTA